MLLPLLVVATTLIVFVLMQAGGSPLGVYLEPGMSQEQVEALEERFHLDDPLPVQYISWLGGVLQGELGWSGVASAPVAEVFPQKLTATIELAVAAAIVAVALGISMGTFAATRRDKFADHVTR